MTETTNSLLAAALRYADLGYPVFPCAPGDNKPITDHGFKDASADPEQIEQWWAERPSANIGIPTQGLLALDVDLLGGEPNPWLTPERQMDLARAPMQLTPGGGRHYLFRQPGGKTWRNTTSALAPKVDTRADGGYIVVPPSARPDGVYRWQETMALDVPPEELPEPPGWLAEALGALADGATTLAPRATSAGDGNPIPSGQRNATLASLAGTMRRAGMTEAEILAAILRANENRCRPPLPEAEVRRVAASIARYAPDTVTVAVAENHWEQMGEGTEDEAVEVPEDPGPVPENLLYVPGFIGELIDFCMANAPYPSLGMAFCGGLSMQGHLCGRKVRDPGDLRTNLYLLALASSSAGKNYPRQINSHLAIAANMPETVLARFASGEGIEDRLEAHPCTMYQTDEIDGILQSVNKSRDARYESIITTLLTMFSSANMMYPMRSKAGKQSGIIHQPHLTIFGTATPGHYYAALSERLLTNGFFARMIIVDTGKRAPGQDTAPVDTMPQRLIETAERWGAFQPGEHRGNLLGFFPQPVTVPYADEAKECADAFRRFADAQYSQAEDRSDEVAMTVWGRANENARKLALLYACSENPTEPQVSLAAVEWATRFITHQTLRMLFMAAEFVARDEFNSLCKRAVRILRDWHAKEGRDAPMPPWKLRRKLSLHPTAFKDAMFELDQRRLVVYDKQPGKTKPRYGYRLVRGAANTVEKTAPEEKNVTGIPGS